MKRKLRTGLAVLAGFMMALVIGAPAQAGTTYNWGIPYGPPAVPVTVNHTAAGYPTLIKVEHATHNAVSPKFDRITFRFQGGYPTYNFQYVPQLRYDPSDQPVYVPGNSFLQIRFHHGRAHNDAGQSTVTARSGSTSYTALKGWKINGDYEGVLSVGLGIQVPANSSVVRLIRAYEQVSGGIYTVAIDVRWG